MSPLRLLFFVLCLLLTASRPLPAAPAPATTAKTSPPAKAEAATGCTAKGCHPAMATGASRHPLKKKCADCHQPRQDRKHPAVKKNAFTLAAAPCLPCHKLVLDQDHLHPPAAAGDCLACHRYHAASPGLLIKDTPQALCRTCHPPVVAKDDTFLHGPIKKGACDLCHRPHGSSYPNLLRANFSKAYENDYNDEQYALCFRCHKIDLLLHPKTSYNTDFRDGKTNLHYVHVNRESAGRSCKLCHETHAGRLPKLMAETVSYGAWSMPLNFEKTATGGRCAPGCHAPREYNHTRLQGGIMTTPPPKTTDNASAPDGKPDGNKVPKQAPAGASPAPEKPDAAAPGDQGRLPNKEVKP